MPTQTQENIAETAAHSKARLDWESCIEEGSGREGRKQRRKEIDLC